jgi:hypothetical protein
VDVARGISTAIRHEHVGETSILCTSIACDLRESARQAVDRLAGGRLDGKSGELGQSSRCEESKKKNFHPLVSFSSLKLHNLARSGCCLTTSV